MHCPQISGTTTSAVVSGFFLPLRAQPPMCRGQHDRHGGQVTTVGKRERVTGAAKIEPLRERLSGMCGSVQH
jgi:hypothetical protein